MSSSELPSTCLHPSSVFNSPSSLSFSTSIIIRAPSSIRHYHPSSVFNSPLSLSFHLPLSLSFSTSIIIRNLVSMKLGKLSVGSVKLPARNGLDDLLAFADGGKHDYDCMMMESNSLDPAPVIPPSNAMSDMPISPTSVASSGHFPFTASDIPGMGVDTSALDTAFQSDVGSSVGLQFQPDGGDGHSKDSLRSLAQIPWNFSLSDLTADLSNLGDLGALGNYPGSRFLHSDSDILLDSPEQDDIDTFSKYEEKKERLITHSHDMSNYVSN